MEIRPKTAIITLVLWAIFVVVVISVTTDNPLIGDISEWLVNHTPKK